MWERIQKFVIAIMSDWFARMSGPLTVPFTIASLFVSSAEYRRLFASLAVSALLVTSYRVWVNEYRRAEAEIAKNDKPEIRGEIFDFKRSGILGDSILKGVRSCSFYLTFKIFLCNHREVSTTIKEIRLDGSAVNPPCVFSEVSVPEDARLDRGIGRGFDKVVRVSVKGKRNDEVEQINTQGLKALVIDSFGQAHLIPVRDGDLSF
jgi:hypothetical protein